MRSSRLSASFPARISSGSSLSSSSSSSSASLSSATPSSLRRKRPISTLTRQLSNASNASADPAAAAAAAAAAAGDPLAADGPEDEAGPREKMTIIPLGGGQEVGRSCIVVQYRGKTIMLDCGLHTQRVGHEALPLLDYFELETVDLLLVTHFHMDHVACLPYLTEKTMFAGRIFMTRPTKAVARLLLQDFVRKNQGQGGAPLYDEADVDACLAKCEVIDTHQTVEHRGIRFRAYTAGHVLGACMFMLEIGGVNVLYTGDYSMEEDRHLMGAEIPSINPDVLIVESTFGIAEHGSREEREQRFTAAVEDIVSKQHGACLIPVFALGRAQELLLLLDEFWRANHHLQSVPVYYANGLSNKALRVYRTYINMMNDHIRSRQLEEPFRFKHISMIQQKDMGKVLPQEGGRQQPCVVLATPGTLEGGLSRSLLEQWCDGKKNGVVLTGFLPEGTIAKDLTRAAADRKLQLRNGGGEKAVSCRVDEMSFAAHVDFAANYDFISRVRPANVVLVHGESRTMDMLKTELVRRTMQWEPANERPSIHNPANVTFEVNPYTNTEMMRGQVNLRFARQKKAKVVGRLADAMADGTIGLGDEVPSAVLVSKDFNLQLMDPQDVPQYAPLHLAGLVQRLHVPFAAKPHMLVALLRRLFDDVAVVERAVVEEQKRKEKEEAGGGGAEKMDEDEEDEPPTTGKAKGGGGRGVSKKAAAAAAAAAKVKEEGEKKKKKKSEEEVAAGDEERLPEIAVTVSSTVRVVLDSETLPGAALLEWDASPAADLIADAVVAAAMHAQSSPHALLMTASAPRPPSKERGGTSTPPPPPAGKDAAGKRGAASKGSPAKKSPGRKGAKAKAAAAEEDEDEEEEDEALEDEEEEDEALEDEEEEDDEQEDSKLGLLDDGALLAASKEALAAAERELLDELAEMLSLRFDSVEIVPDKARREEDDDEAEAAEQGGEGRAAPSSSSSSSLSSSSTLSSSTGPADSDSIKVGQRWALRVREEVVRGAIATMMASGKPPPPEGYPYTVVCTVRWLRSGLSVQGTPPPEGVETRLQEQQQQLQQQFMILQPDGSLAVAPQHQAAYKDAAAVVATRAQEFARWETKQGALEQQVQSALAHAAVSLRPVRADARWS